MAFTGTESTVTEQGWPVGQPAAAEPPDPPTVLEPEDEPDEDPEYWAMVVEIETVLAGEEPSGVVSQDLATTLSAAGRAMDRARLPVPETVQLYEPALVEGVRSLGRIRRQADAAAFSLVREAHERGLHTQAGLSVVDWLRHQMPGMSLSEACQHSDVVKFAVTPEGMQLGDAMLAGDVALHRAAMVARTMRRLRSSLTPEQRERYTEIATAAAGRRDLPDNQLGQACRKLIEDLLDESEPGERDRRAHELRNASTRRLANGLTRITIDAPDLAAGKLSGIMSSALAAPQPTEDGPDMRSGGQRRFDALMTVVDRGLGNPGAPPSTARSTVILTIRFDPETGQPSGPGATPTGEFLSRREAAQMACDGEITPVWLSPEGEPLKLGETARFATPGQWKALVARDQHCSYPGCSRLPQWCDTHHLVQWARGGTTDIDKLALLCGQHHTHVHSKDIVGEVVGGTVVWHV